jgi:cobalt-zinc-cadmium efflux system outer membrane protein
LGFGPIFCFAAGVSALAPAVSLAQDTPRLTRSAAVAEALAKNPRLAASRAQVEEARAGIAQATAFPDPTFSWDYEQQSSITNFRSAQARDIGAGFTIPFPDKFRLNRRVTEAALHAAELAHRQLQQELASDTAVAYDALLVALAQLANDRQSEQFSSDILEKTRARYEAGTVARLDVLQAGVNLAQAKNQTITDGRAAMTATATLNRSMGRAAGSALELADELGLPADLPGLPDLLKLAEDSRPEIASVRAQREGARFATKLAREFWFPDLNVTLYRNYTQGAPAAYSTAGTIGVPLFFWQHERGDVAFAESRQIELAANETDTVAQVDLDVRTAIAAAESARRQGLWIRDELLPQARETYDVAEKSYSLGGSSLLDLINAKATLLAATTQLTQALGAASDAFFQLEKAVGSTIPNGISGGSHAP